MKGGEQEEGKEDRGMEHGRRCTGAREGDIMEKSKDRGVQKFSLH